MLHEIWVDLVVLGSIRKDQVNRLEALKKGGKAVELDQVQVVVVLVAATLGDGVADLAGP